MYKLLDSVLVDYGFFCFVDNILYWKPYNKWLIPRKKPKMCTYAKFRKICKYMQNKMLIIESRYRETEYFYLRIHAIRQLQKTHAKS